MLQKNLSFQSTNGINSINAVILTPDKGKEILGIIQISHGIYENIENYLDFANFITTNGFIVALHSYSDSNIYTKDFVNEKDSHKFLIKDFNRFHLLIKNKYTNFPYFIMGHSTGSTIVQNYLAIYGIENINGFILSGITTNISSNKLTKAFTTFLLKAHESKLQPYILNKLLQKKYDNYFKNIFKNKQNNKIQNNSKSMEKSNFTFSYSSFIDIINLINFTTKNSWFESIDDDAKILMISGSDDKFGNYGKSPKEIYKKLCRVGVDDTTLTIYQNSGHDLLSDDNKIDVYNDILIWILKRI